MGRGIEQYAEWANYEEEECGVGRGGGDWTKVCKERANSKERERFEFLRNRFLAYKVRVFLSLKQQLCVHCSSNVLPFHS